MEKIINSFSEYIAIELKLDEDKKKVIAYGTFVLMQTIISILLLILFGIIFKCTMEALIISFTVSILRKYSGGVHASSSGRCALLGTMICIGGALLIIHLLYPVIDIRLLIITELIAFIYSYFTTVKLVPVDNPKKPIKSIKKKEKMKKISLTIVTIYLIIISLCIFLWVYTGKNIFVIYSLCIELGLLWQVFTLTSMGHLLVFKLDKLLKNLI